MQILHYLSSESFSYYIYMDRSCLNIYIKHYAISDWSKNLSLYKKLTNLKNAASFLKVILTNYKHMCVGVVLDL